MTREMSVEERLETLEKILSYLLKQDDRFDFSGDGATIPLAWEVLTEVQSLLERT